MSWHHLVRFMQHIEGSKMAKALQSAVDHTNIDRHDLSDDAMARILSSMHKALCISQRQRDYLHRLLLKGRQFSYFGECMLLHFMCSEHVETSSAVMCHHAACCKLTHIFSILTFSEHFRSFLFRGPWRRH